MIYGSLRAFNFLWLLFAYLYYGRIAQHSTIETSARCAPLISCYSYFLYSFREKKTEASSPDWIKWRISHFPYEFSLSHGENADFVKEANTFQPLILLSSNSGHLKDEWREEKNTQKNAI